MGCHPLSLADFSLLRMLLLPQPWVLYLPWKGLKGFEIPQGYAVLGCLGTEVPFEKQILPSLDSQLLGKQVYEW